jgi:hypothetical protein
MTDEADWTPMIGWRKAALQIPVRAAISLAITWVAFWLLYAFIRHLESETGNQMTTIGYGIIFLLGLGAGMASGRIISRGLMESTGLLGSHLAGPSLVAFVVGLWALQCLTTHIAPDWRIISLWVILVSGIVGTGMALRQFIMDS